MTDEENSKEEEPQAGDLINFTKEVDFGVMDEEGNRIPCKNIAEAKILSLLLEIQVKLEKALIIKKSEKSKEENE